MIDLLSANIYFGVFMTLAAFTAGRAMQSRWKSPLLNPILIAAALIIGVLLSTGISVERYQESCKPLQYLLTPATICFAVSLYEQLGKLKKHLVAILAGVSAGTVASLLSIRLMCMAFGLDRTLTVSLLPKSITTAIGMALSEEAGGIAALTTAAIVLTGNLGNMFGPMLCKWFRLTDPVAQGVAFGTSAHAIGTSKAAELSELAGAVSSLSLTFAGLITAILYSFLL